MTFRELFRQQKGYDVIANNPITIPCPHKFGYEHKNPEVCRRMLDCKACWEREVPDDAISKYCNIVDCGDGGFEYFVVKDGAVTESFKVECDKSMLHEKLCAELTDTYRRKNHDYGDSFHQSYAEDGLTMAKIRIGDKYNRFKSLIKSDQKVKEESIRDTLIDMANYCIMTVIELDGEQK